MHQLCDLDVIRLTFTESLLNNKQGTGAMKKITDNSVIFFGGKQQNTIYKRKEFNLR